MSRADRTLEALRDLVDVVQALPAVETRQIGAPMSRGELDELLVSLDVALAVLEERSS